MCCIFCLQNCKRERYYYYSCTFQSIYWLFHFQTICGCRWGLSQLLTQSGTCVALLNVKCCFDIEWRTPKKCNSWHKLVHLIVQSECRTVPGTVCLQPTLILELQCGWDEKKPKRIKLGSLERITKNRKEVARERATKCRWGGSKEMGAEAKNSKSKAEEERERTEDDDETKWVKMLSIKDDELKRELMTLALSKGIRISLEKILWFEMERGMRQCWAGSIKRQMNDGERQKGRGGD